MKQKTIFLIVLMLLSSLATTFAKIQLSKNSKEKEKIELREEGKMIRSGTLIEVVAYYNGSTLELFVNNYTGSVTMHIPGSSLHVTVGINGAGYAVMDISQLPEGNHTFQVMIGNTIFEGNFEL